MLILAVDDDPDDIELFRFAIKNLDPSISCIIASDGLEALSLLNEELILLPDYIFLDINMPRMGGVECLTLIRANINLQDIPVIMYSTSSNMEQIQFFKSLNAQFLEKATDFNKLMTSLKQVFTHY